VNGARYEGEFGNNYFHGQGRMTCANGMVKAGIWEKGELVKADRAQSTAYWEEYLNWLCHDPVALFLSIGFALSLAWNYRQHRQRKSQAAQLEALRPSPAGGDGDG